MGSPERLSVQPLGVLFVHEYRYASLNLHSLDLDYFSTGSEEDSMRQQVPSSAQSPPASRESGAPSPRTDAASGRFQSAAAGSTRVLDQPLLFSPERSITDQVEANPLGPRLVEEERCRRLKHVLAQLLGSFGHGSSVSGLCPPMRLRQVTGKRAFRRSGRPVRSLP